MEREVTAGASRWHEALEASKAAKLFFFFY
jgi:hypothetical protein